MAVPTERNQAVLPEQPPLADWLEALSHDSPFEHGQDSFIWDQVAPRLALVPVLISFLAWHLFRGGGCTRSQLDDCMAPLLLELLAVLQTGLRCRNRKTKRFCERLLGVYAALWTFVVVEGVEPTNNHVERVQRRAVLWRRRSFGCHSAAGCRFVERTLTVVQTLRLQQRSVLQFLHEAIQAHRSGLPGPVLVLGQ